MGLLDFLETPQGQALASGIATYAATAQRGTPWNNIGRGLLGGGIAYSNANEKAKNEREWKRVIDAGKTQTPTFEWVSRPGYQYKDAFYESPEEAYKAAGIDPSKAVTRGIGGERYDIDTRNIDINGVGEIAPTGYVKQYNYAPRQWQQDGVPVPDIKRTSREFMVPGIPKESFDPNSALRAALTSNNMEVVSKAAPVFAAYAKAEQDQLENKAMADVQEALQRSGGDVDKSISALLQVGNYKGATALMNAVKARGGDSAAISNWNQRQSMIKAGATKEEIAAFDSYVRANQMGNLGNLIVPFSGVTGQPVPGLPPVASVPGQPNAGYAVGLKPGEQPKVQAAQEAAKTEAKITAEDKTHAKVNASKTKDQSRYMIGVIDKMLAHPGKSDYIGTITGGYRAMIPGTDAANFKTYFDQVTGQQFLQAYETLKGGGQITEIEGAKAQAAMSRMNRSQSVKEFDEAATEFRSIIEAAMKRNQDKAALTPSEGTRAAPIQGEGFKMLPNAKEFDGRTITDTKTGKKYKSVGGMWKEAK